MAQRAKRGLATWITSSTTPLFVLDSRRVVLVFNRGCETLTGWTAAEVIGKEAQWRVHVDSHNVKCLTASLCPPQSVLQGSSLVVPTAMRSRDGTLLNVLIHFFPLRDDADPHAFRTLGVIVANADSASAQPHIRNVGNRSELFSVLSQLQQRYGVDSIVAKTDEMRRVVAQIAVAAQSEVTVQFQGEVGVGKEHLARHIHYNSNREQRRFVTVHCRTSSHFEIQRILKRISAEDRNDEAKTLGTVCLRDVDSLSQDLQAVVCDQLRSGSAYRWICSVETDDTDKPVPAAETLSPLLSAMVIQVPPLRRRRDEICLLATWFLDLINRTRETPIEEITEDVYEEFLAYEWPGNVAELEKVVHAAANRCRSRQLDVGDLPVSFHAGRDAQTVRPQSKSETLDEYLQRIERERICEVLGQVQGNRSAAAERLGMPRAKLYRRLKSLGIDAPEE